MAAEAEAVTMLKEVTRVLESMGKRSMLEAPRVFLRVMVEAEDRLMRW